MCGFAAIVSLSGAPIDLGRLRRMTHIQRHRGPDDEGYVLAGREAVVSARGDETHASLEYPAIDTLADRQWTLGIGVRRLAIRDLGPSGHQPMSDPQGGLWLAFNGELYGDADVRRQLVVAGMAFQVAERHRDADRRLVRPGGSARCGG